MKNIMDMTMEELKEYADHEVAKAGFDFVELDKEGLPQEYVTAVQYIYDNIYDCDYFKKDKYKIALIEEYIPMGGYIWRIIIFDKIKAAAKMQNISNDNNQINIKRIIGGSQVLSIYYDTNDVLGVMGQPYFEMYNGEDVERYLAEEYKTLYNHIETELARIIH